MEDNLCSVSSGDAVILRLTSPLPADITITPIGDGSGSTYTVAAYGTTDERRPHAFRVLYEAMLITGSPYTLARSESRRLH